MQSMAVKNASLYPTGNKIGENLGDYIVSISASQSVQQQQR